MRFMTGECLKAAEYDLKTIEAIIDNEFLTPTIAFHCQQCVEKCFKAILEEYEQEPVKIHNLKTLHNKVSQFVDLQIDWSVVSKLDELYIESRYPGEAGLLPNGKPSMDEAKSFYEFAENIHKSIKLSFETDNEVK